MKRAVRQRPESVPVAALLIGVGGFLDAYTFVRHGVFANAQSGNIVLIAVNGAQRNWGEVATKVPAVVAYVVGALAAHLLSTERARALLRRPTRVVLVLEMTVLGVVGALPYSLSTLALTVPVSFVAALQTVVFTRVAGVSYNTTVATGNLRAMVAAFFSAAADRDADQLRAGGMLLGLLVAFAAGAGIGALTTEALQQRAALVAVVALAAALASIILETRRREGAAGRGEAESA